MSTVVDSPDDLTYDRWILGGGTGPRHFRSGGHSGVISRAISRTRASTASSTSPRSFPTGNSIGILSFLPVPMSSSRIHGPVAVPACGTSPPGSSRNEATAGCRDIEPRSHTMTPKYELDLPKTMAERGERQPDSVARGRCRHPGTLDAHPLSLPDATNRIVNDSRQVDNSPRKQRTEFLQPERSGMPPGSSARRAPATGGSRSPCEETAADETFAAMRPSRLLQLVSIRYGPAPILAD